MALKALTRKALRKVGYDIRRTHAFRPNPIVTLGFNLVFDCGANRGQYARSLRRDGYEGMIVSIEPGSKAYSALQKEAKSDSNWVIHRRCAIGDRDGTANLNIASNDLSSSLAPLLEESAISFVTSEEVEVQTLDNIAQTYILQEKTILLKLDLQGNEAEALLGGAKLIQLLSGIQLELCTEPTYQGQKGYAYFFSAMNDLGFHLALIDPFGIDNRSGVMKEFDALFVKSDLFS